VPLFAQAVLGTSATAAGAMLTPQLLSWVFASIIGSRLLLRFGYRPLALIGMVLLTLGTFLLTRVSVGASQISLMFYLGLMGAGMGLSIPAFLIAVQSAVHRSKLGAATSTIQFSRSIGGTLGVSVMGAMLSIWLNNALTAAGLDSSKISVQSLIDPLASANQSLEGPLRAALASAMQGVFIIALVGAALGLVATFFSPRGLIAQESGAAPVEAPLPELHS
jgi:Na+/melibiose symporter-like transporter